jgi:predicted small metal-binding protein
VGNPDELRQPPISGCFVAPPTKERFAAKVLHCRGLGFDCDAVVGGQSIDEIMGQVRPHAAEVHGVEVTPDMEQQMVRLVRDDPVEP